MATPPDIYGAIVERCRPAMLPGPWRRFAADPSCLQPPEDAAALLASLQKTFSADDLVKARVVVTAAGGARLHPSLTDPASIIVVVRRSLTELPVDLIIDGPTTMAGFPVPLVRVLRDDEQYLRHPPNLYIARSMHEVAVLRALGFPAAPVTGLAALGGRVLDIFCRAMGRDRHPRGNAMPEKLVIDTMVRGQALVLVGWQPADLARGIPEEIDCARRHLRGIERNFDITLDGSGVWYPSRADLRSIKFSVRHGDLQNVRESMRASYEAHCSSLDHPPGPPRVKSYAERRREWLDAAPRGASRARTDAWLAVNDSFNEQIVEPLLQQAVTSDDILSQLLLTNLASVSSVYHTQAMAMTAWLCIASHNRPVAELVLPPAQFDQQCKALDKILALTGAIDRRRSPHGNQR